MGLKHNKAVSVYWDCITQREVSKKEIELHRKVSNFSLPRHIKHFASKLERDVYLILLASKRSAFTVKTQYRVKIVPSCSCYPKGKQWACDFALVESSTREPFKYVEAKGIITRDFQFILANTELYNPEVFKRLHLVFGHEIPESNLVIRNLTKSSCNYPRIFTLREFQRYHGL